MSGPKDDLAADPAPAVDVPLRRNRSFQLLWLGSVFSFLGAEMATVVYPLVILMTTGSPSWAGIFGGVQILSTLCLGLPGGELADRFDRRRLLLVGDGVRIVATGSVAVAVAADALTLGHLMAVAVVMGAIAPVGGAARTVLVRTLVPSHQLTAALTQDEVRSHGASLTGPPLGTWLYSLAAAVPLFATASLYVTSFCCAVFIRVPQAARGGRAGKPANDTFMRRMAAGLTVLWKSPLLRNSTLFSAVINLAEAPLILAIVVQLKGQGHSEGLIGLVLAALAVGGLTGTLLVEPLHRLLPPGRLMLATGAVTAVLVGVLPMGGQLWWVAGCLFLLGLVGPPLRVLADILVFRQVPDEQRGRVISAFMTVLGAGTALGVFGGGLLLASFSVEATMLVFTGVLAVALVLGVTSRVLRNAAWPQDIDDENNA